MATGRPRVFTIPPAAPFLPTLIGALRDGTLLPGFPAGDGPLALAAATIYLPTQRAVRAARLAFLDALGDAAMLPRLAPLGDIDEDELIFAAARSDRALEIAPALGALERRLVLAQLVQRWSRAADLRGIDSTPLVARTPAAALALADALARLMDDMITRGVPWSNLDTLVPDHLDKYWQLTLDFLRIARDVWPDYLAAAGTIEPAARRDALIAAEAARLAANPDAPVIAAGSTASMPATAQLLSTIARLPHGAVVLPGLDTHLDEPSWQLIGGARDAATGRARNPAVTHPQFAMHAFLSGLAMHREEVVTLGDIDDARTALVSEAMRPAATSEQWHTVRPSPAALGGITVIEAAHAEEEAQAIAVVLREAVEHRKSAALVTPDRALARRVAVALQRWSVSVDDTAGDALVDTPAGVFARLAVTVATDGYPPIDLLALAKHPMLRLGARAGRNTRAVAVLERAVLRGPRPRAGSAGIAAALTSFRAARADLYRTDPRKTIGESDLDAAAAFVETLSAALTPLEQVRAQAPLAHFAALHRDAILALTAGDDADDPLRGRDGEALLAALDEIAESDAAARTTVSRRDYREVFEATIAGAVVRHAANPDADVRIFGLLEARLQHADRLVLGGLVETVWPPQTRSDPWLSRPMRQELGLDLPERRIGLTAHDFAQALGAREVFITRAAKVGGAPTVASR
ncbi:MAG: double-strand break repair protein AddB, partial [Rhizobiales bacterium]|nr:double-strand break repair protein AddB [Hyphomicrobiales bacterium]